MNGGTLHRFRVISRSYDLGIFRNFPNERTWMFFVWVMFLLLILSKLWKMNEHLESEDVSKSSWSSNCKGLERYFHGNTDGSQSLMLKRCDSR